MRAAQFDQFGGPLRIAEAPQPQISRDGVLIEVRATGICRSDWHGWQGHDPDIRTLPHVPGHEFAGKIVEIGADVRSWRPGQRVTMPFVAGCGDCRECRAGAPQVCDAQFQPGFSAWGSFAEFVAVRYADFNLCALPEEIDDVSAASFGCRLATAYRAVAAQGRLQRDEWIAIHGCGGVGLSAVMIAAALGGRVVGVDVKPEARQLAESLGAVHTIDRAEGDVPDAIRNLTDGGAHLSLDALGSGETAANSIRCLRKRGRHVQVGLLAGPDARPRLPMEVVIAGELQIVGSHGMAAADYPALFALATAGRIDPRALVQRTIALSEAPQALAAMERQGGPGITVVDQIQ